MSEKPRKSATQMDEELAALTDRLLGDQPVEESGLDPEVDTLKATLFQLKSIAKEPPAEEMRQRIEKQLISEWKKDPDLVGKKDARRAFLPGAQPRTSRRWSMPVFAFAVTLLAIILIVVLPINPIITSNIQGTAGTAAQDPIILFGLVVLLGIALVWLSRKKP